MTLQEQAYTQAILLAGDLSERQRNILNVLCDTNYRALHARLRNGLAEDDCKADMVAAVSLLALADLSSMDDEQPEQITAGDFTIRRGNAAAASNCLRSQAELMIAPYLQNRFSFQGV